MEFNCCIRKLEKEEREPALSLVWKVFQEYEAPDYSKEGMDEFYKSIHDERYLSLLCMYGAFVDEKLVGVITTRSEGTHIALFFVDGQYQRKGIGKKLFKTVLSECVSDRMTVYAAPYGITIYRKLGFTDTDKEQVVNGLRFTPMEYNK
ncbi:MAG: GNAT family N-acetyltransferase [Clostridiales bacterium]|nr:GNAT family N-acetyltransferase [Clostridiales bacterium]